MLLESYVMKKYMHMSNIFAKRSVVSAANYAQRSSFAKDQILFFFL